eukprot:scaffold132860_cov17-Tisochrysis_lutea.AAC.2
MDKRVSLTPSLEFSALRNFKSAHGDAGLESPALLDESEKHLLDYCHANAHLLPATLKLLSEERHPPHGWNVQPGRVMCSTNEKAS